MSFDNFGNENGYINTYPRQPYLNSFEISMETVENEKPYPTQSNYSRSTIPVTPSMAQTTDNNNLKPPMRLDKKPCICHNVHRFCQFIGKGWLFPRNYRNHSWCIADVCGSICALITWLLIGYAVFVVLFVMIIPSPSFLFKWINGLGFLFFSSLAFFSHLKAMFTNPGAVALGNATSENIERACSESKKTIYKCVKCDSLKPQRAHHCSICRRCIVKMDHHCPWVNNCIGEKNQKYFVLFTFYIFVISVYSIYISVHFFMMCVGSEWEQCKEGFSPAASTILIIFLLVEGVLFGLFTAIMCGEQLQSICSDQTGIETLKGEQRTWERRSRWSNLQSVFGYPTSWKWLSPLTEPKIQSCNSEMDMKFDYILNTV